MRLDVSGMDLNLSLNDEVIGTAIDKAMPELVSSTQSALSDHRRTGSLISSVGASKAKQNSEGWYAGISFKGSDEYGVRNGLKAAELEYGNSCQPAAPFADRAVSMSENKIVSVIENNLDDLISFSGGVKE